MLKRGKNGGHDGISNEHLLYGGSTLTCCLAKLFNSMYTMEYVPHGYEKGADVYIIQREP